MTERERTATASAILDPVVTLHLGGRSYPIPRKVMGENRPWRERFQSSSAPLQSLLGLISNAEGATWGAAINSLDTRDIARAAESFLPALLSSVDEIADLVFMYDPSLESDRAYILAHCYDEDVIEAFVQIVKAVYPLKTAGGAIAGAMSAPATTT